MIYLQLLTPAPGTYLPDTVGARIASPSDMRLLLTSCSFPAGVGWKSPFQHLNPTSVEIYTFGHRIRAISRPSLSKRSRAPSGDTRTYRSGIAHDRHRCTAQRVRMDIPRYN